MSIASDLTSREQTKFLESSSVSGQPGIVVINPDGTNIGSVPSGSVGAFSTDISAALEASTVTKASAGRFFGLYGRIDKTATSNDYWIQVLNASSLPADGAVTILTSFKKVHTNGTDTFLDLDLRQYGIYASTGIVVVLSTTEFTKTIGGAYLSTTVLYT